MLYNERNAKTSFVKGRDYLYTFMKKRKKAAKKTKKHARRRKRR